VQTENEKAVRTLFEEWLAETQYAQDSESFHNELYSAWKSGRQSAERSQAALQSQSNTDGWVMVPVEPTEEMIMAGYEGQGEATYPAVRDAYRAMLSAAPTPPQQVSNTPQDAIGYVMENYAEFYAKHGQTVMTPEPESGRIPVYATPPQQTPQDGWKALPVRNIEAAFHPCEFQVTVGFKSCRAASEFMAALKAPPQQQEQSGEAVKAFGYAVADAINEEHALGCGYLSSAQMHAIVEKVWEDEK
jgi:hypothetical protein